MHGLWRSYSGIGGWFDWSVGDGRRAVWRGDVCY